jgi:PAT family beta-lactamase induction signal transducer AmpG
MSISSNQTKSALSEIIKSYTKIITLRMFFLGFSAGLPLLLVLGTLGFWLREAGIDRSTIGFLSWIGLIYGFKWVWSPFVDRLKIPFLSNALGRRKSWLLFAQMLVMLGLIGMSMSDPSKQVHTVAWFAILVAFGSATQDIALDAFRIESADTKMQGVLAAAYQAGYRFAMIWAGAGALWIAARAQTSSENVYDVFGWQTAYLVMAASMLIGVITVLFSQEKPYQPNENSHSLKGWIKVAFLEPFTDFLKRYKWQAVLILSLIAVYRISDVVMGIMANPFYVDMGYTKDEVAGVTKVFGVIMTLLGAFIGGGLTVRFGIYRILMLGAILSAASNILFAWLATRGHDLTGLIFVISADNLSSGIASAAFIAYLSSLTNVSYSATQYALFSSMMLLVPKWLAGFSGVYVDHFGYSHFFISTALIGIPVLILVWMVRKQLKENEPSL